MGRKRERSPEEEERRAKIRELLQTTRPQRRVRAAAIEKTPNQHPPGYREKDPVHVRKGGNGKRRSKTVSSTRFEILPSMYPIRD